MAGLLGVETSVLHKGPYDVEIRSRGRRFFVEVKTALRRAKLLDRVRSAFRREHPEPFAVVGVLGFRRAWELPGWAWVWLEPPPARFWPITSLRPWKLLGVIP
mgnify:CR=1 FL=1